MSTLTQIKIERLDLYRAVLSWILVGLADRSGIPTIGKRLQTNFLSPTIESIPLHAMLKSE